MTLAVACKRINISDAASELGVPERTVRDLALRGEVPGAAKVGRRWTFDLDRLREHIRRLEALACQSARPRRAPSGATASYGGARKSARATTSGRARRLACAPI